MTSNNVENNQLIGHAETENDYQNAQHTSEAETFCSFNSKLEIFGRKPR